MKKRKKKRVYAFEREQGVVYGGSWREQRGKLM